MTFDNPHPMANPLNRGFYRSTKSFQRTSNSSELHVPNQDIPVFGSNEYYDQRQQFATPNQDIPPGDQLHGAGFLNGSDNLFRLSDGTIVDFKTRTISYSKKSNRYWGNPDKTLTMTYNGMEWRDDSNPTIGDMLNDMEKYRNRTEFKTSLPLDRRSASYWLKAEEEAEKLIDRMTDSQKQMLADFEKHFPKSKLIEESEKQRN